MVIILNAVPKLVRMGGQVGADEAWQRCKKAYSGGQTSRATCKSHQLGHLRQRHVNECPQRLYCPCRRDHSLCRHYYDFDYFVLKLNVSGTYLSTPFERRVSGLRFHLLRREVV